MKWNMQTGQKYTRNKTIINAHTETETGNINQNNRQHLYRHSRINISIKKCYGSELSKDLVSFRNDK